MEYPAGEQADGWEKGRVRAVEGVRRGLGWAPTVGGHAQGLEFILEYFSLRSSRTYCMFSSEFSSILSPPNPVPMLFQNIFLDGS